jgi:hypothetical protein
MSENIPSGNPELVSDLPEKKDSVAYETFSKLLGEKKKLQSEMSEMKAIKDQLEADKLQAEGKWKELAENNKKLVDEYKSKNLNIVKNVSEKAIRSQFLREAEKLGCVDAETAMKVCSFDDLEVTEDFEFDSQKLIVKIQELTKTKPFLFKKDFKLPKDVQPTNSQPATKSISAMSTDELLKQYKEILQKQ